MRDEGLGGFYKGIRPAWARDAAEKSFRLGLYEPIKIMVGAAVPGASPLRKFLAGAIAGAFGAFTGNPFNVLKLKLMACKDGKMTAKDLIKEIWDNQGINGFYVGFQSSVLRAMVINAS
jgi:solute carrier family 25 uncoupling protein 8/9/solute carrier family 25 protein 14/30